MLLNSFGQPTLLTCERNYLNIDEFKESPLLLCHKNSLKGKLLPKDWSGCMYTSQNILDDIRKTNYKITDQQYTQKALLPNKPVDIALNDQVNNNNIFLDNHIQLTMIPWDEENFFYIIKDQYVTNLLTDSLSENMESFIVNKTLRQILKDVDVLYLNDGVYQKSPQLPEYPTECLLGALVTVVQPRYVVGISGNELPQYIYDCCKPEDLLNPNQFKMHSLDLEDISTEKERSISRLGEKFHGGLQVKPKFSEF